MSEDRMTGVTPFGDSVPLAAFVTNVDADTIRIVAAPGYTLALFQPPGQAIEVVISGDTDTWRLRVREASDIETLTITFPEAGVVEFKYGNLFA